MAGEDAARVEVTHQRVLRSHWKTATSAPKVAPLAGSIRQVVTSKAQWKRVLENMQDIDRVLVARGVDLPAHRSALLPARLPTWLTVPAMRLALRLSRPLRAMTDANVNEHEARGCLNSVMEEAHRLGVRVPHLEEAQRQLQPG